MNIAVVYQGRFPPEKGASGSDRRVRDITRGLAQDNVVTMLVPYWNKSSKENLDISDFSINYLGAKSWNKLSSRFSFWNEVKRFCEDKGVEVILFYNTTFDGVRTAKQLKNDGVKVAYEICDLPSSNISGVKKYLVKYGEDNMPKSTNLNIAISEFLEERVKNAAPNTATMRIPILVDADTFKYKEDAAIAFRKNHNINQDDVLIAYAGGTWKQEGLKYLVDAFDLLTKEKSNVKLVIAGRLVKKSADHDDVESLILSKSLEESIIALGWVTTDDIVQLYSAADILALPQIDNTFNIAGLPTKLAEYSSMGKAIVATDVGDVTEYFTDGKNIKLCKHSDPISMKKALISLADNSQLRGSLGEGAKSVASTEFDYKICGQKILKMLVEIS